MHQTKFSRLMEFLLDYLWVMKFLLHYLSQYSLVKAKNCWLNSLFMFSTLYQCDLYDKDAAFNDPDPQLTLNTVFTTAARWPRLREAISPGSFRCFKTVIIVLAPNLHEHVRCSPILRQNTSDKRIKRNLSPQRKVPMWVFTPSLFRKL